MSKYQALIDAMKAGPVEYACHCDLEPHMQPDGCVLDEGKPENCIYAERLVKRGLSKTDCAEWKPISVVKPTIDVKAEDLRALLADLEMAEKALAALAQQAQEREPVAAVLGDIVALWDLYAPSQHMTAMHMHAKRALAGQQPVSPDMHRWCAYVGVMVAHWVMSEPNAHVRLGDDQFEASIAGIIERRLWAMPKRDTTPQPQPAPAPVDDRAEFEASMREKHGWVARDFQSDSFGYFDGHTATAWLAWQARAALQSPAPQTKGGEA